MRLNILSCGAGVQSTTLALLACSGDLPGLDAAIFADTGWEPAQVYRQVDRIEAELAKAGIPLHRVSQGNLRADSIDPNHRFVSVPWFVKGPCTLCDGTGQVQSLGLEVAESTASEPWYVKFIKLVGAESLADAATKRLRYSGKCPKCNGSGETEGMGRRQCTAEYKLSPIMRKCRELLGAAPPDFRRVPKGNTVVQWIGFSTDEIHRVDNKRANLYSEKRYPLLELGMSRKDCQRYLERAGWGDTAKSACIGCPFHGNAQWRDLRDNHPEEWADAVDFDRAIRKGGARGLPRGGEAFLHRSRLPLDQAPIDRVTPKEWADRQLDIYDVLESGDPDGCSPYGCRSGEAVTLDEEQEAS